MVDQTKITENANGEGSVIHNLSEFAADVVSLCELQMRLFALDGQEALQKLMAPIALFCGGIAALIGCIPVALATIAVLLAEYTSLSLGQAFLIALGAGLVLGGVVAYSAWQSMGEYKTYFARSIRECDANSHWIKGVLQRLGRRPHDHPQGSNRMPF